MPKQQSSKPQAAKERREARTGGSKRRKRLLPVEVPVMDQPFEVCIADVRLAVKLLREAALSPIPDLDEVAPDRFEGFGAWKAMPPYPKETGNTDTDAKALRVYERAWDGRAREINAWDQRHNWSERARKRAREAFEWRDELTRRIGSIDVPNDHPRHDDWDEDRLAEERGYRLVDPDPALSKEGRGPPETLLGEFYHYADTFARDAGGTLVVPVRYADMVDLLVSTGLVERSKVIVEWDRHKPVPYDASMPHWNRQDGARAFLGLPPRHLTDTPTYKRLTEQIWMSHANRLLAEGESLVPFAWWQYAETILQQCLLERARALELCAWCDQRIEAWESAYFPTIIIGPEGKKARARSLQVKVAGTMLKLERDSIPCADASRLLSLRGGRKATFDYRKYADNLLKLIPPLRGLLRGVRTISRNSREYVLAHGVQVVELAPEEDNE